MTVQASGIFGSGFKMGSLNAGDPHFANVSLLLHGDGTNNSTVITDSSSFAKTVTPAGAFKISTATKKYGTGSISCVSGSSSLAAGSITSGFNFGTGDFTIETWAYLIAGVGNYQMLWTISYNGNQYLQMRYGDVGFGSRLQMAMNGADLSRIYSPNYTDSSMAGAWYHIAMVRSSSNMSLYINGVLQTIRNNNYSGTPVTSYVDNTNISSIQAVNFGGPTYSYNGFLDEVRITKGVARYTGNFTPPTAAFPSS